MSDKNYNNKGKIFNQAIVKRAYNVCTHTKLSINK